MNNHPFRFFGTGRVFNLHDQPIAMRSRKQLALLAYLAVEHQIAHSRETLLALLWPDEATPVALNNLRVTLSRLREIANKVRGKDGEGTALLAADHYTVQLEQAWIDSADVNRFNHLLEGTRRHEHRSRGQCKECQAHLQAAVQLYQGSFLDGFGLDDCSAFEEWLFMQRERLNLLVHDAYSDLAIYAESNGDWRAARTFAQRQIDLDPLCEPAYRQQMRILSKEGQRSAALAVFERCRSRLIDELGLDPEPETLTLHMQILTSESATPRTTIATEPLSRRHNLPQQLTPFIGREDELEQLQRRLADSTYRLLSIVGPGGIGKSRLAQQVVAQQLERFTDGVFFVRLAQIQQAESIPAAIAETLGLTFSAGPLSPIEQLIERVCHTHLLLVLDNFEHLIDGVDLLVQLLQHTSKLVLLVTSRERLNIQAEDLFELQGLSTPSSLGDSSASSYAAVRLFVDRAHRLDKQFKLHAELLPAIVRICQRVEGFPLALELAATWVHELSCVEIEAELAGGLAGLETTLRDIEPQHRSLRAVFNSSWRLLSEIERRTLAKLAVFRGGFSMEAARTIANATPVLLAALRNKSLLRNAGGRRYDMHALVHQFASEALMEDAQAAPVLDHAHSRYFLTLLTEQTVALDTRNAGVAGAKIQADWENVVLAWQHATTHEELQQLQNALDGLVRFCDLRGLYREGQTLLEKSLDQFERTLDMHHADQVADQLTNQLDQQRLRLCCHLLTALAYFAECRDEFEQTMQLCQKALVLATKLNSIPEIIGVYLNQAKAFELVGEYRQGMALAEKTLHMAQEAGLELQAGICLELIGYNAAQLDDYDRSRQMYHQLLAFHEQSGRLELPARLATSILGTMAIEQGDYEVGLNHCQRFLESSQATDDRINTAQAFHYLANAWTHLGNFEQAIAMATQSTVRASVLGDRRMIRSGLRLKAWACRLAGQLEESLHSAREAVMLAQTLNAHYLLASALGQVAETQMAMAQSEDEWTEAAATFGESVAGLRGTDSVVLVYETEIGLAELMRRWGKIDSALQLIQPILPHLPTLSADGWDEPIRAYVVCTEILRAVNDPGAEVLLEQGLQLLDCLAQKITDHTLRQNFLQAIPAHRQLRALRFDE